jgi:hypothetical protein
MTWLIEASTGLHARKRTGVVDHGNEIGVNRRNYKRENSMRRRRLEAEKDGA